MPAEDVVTVLAVSPLDEDFVFLEHVFAHSKWNLNRVRTCREAREAMRERPTPVIVCEHRLPDGTWRDVLADTARVDTPPRLIVSSFAADDQLWAEVLDSGGYDVLGKPFDRSELVRSISLAWRQWKYERERGGRVQTARPSE